MPATHKLPQTIPVILKRLYPPFAHLTPPKLSRLPTIPLTHVPALVALPKIPKGQSLKLSLRRIKVKTRPGNAINRTPLQGNGVQLLSQN
jgi:hypothetical protein